MALKKNLTFRILVPLFFVVLFIVLVTTSSPEIHNNRDFPEIRESGILKVVTDYNSSGYYVSDDTIAGFNSELLKVIGQYSDLKIEVEVENNLEKCLQGLKDKKYDLIARNIPVNANLKNDVGFTQPIVHNKLVLVQRQPQKDELNILIRNHLDLAKKTIHVPISSPAILRIKNLSHEIGDTIFIKEDSLYEISQLIMKVAAGEIDYTVSDVNTARILSEKLKKIDIGTNIGFTHLEAWAVRKDNPLLLDSLNAWLNRFQNTKDFLRLYNRYYKK